VQPARLEHAGLRALTAARKGFADMWIIKNVLLRQGRGFFCLIALLAVMSTPGLSSLCAAENLKDFTAFSFIDNHEINTVDLRGNILVMVFGSIYCKPCVELLPVMKMLHESYVHSNVRIILLDIDMAVSPELQREFVERHAIKEPYINNALQIARDNKVYMLPTTLIVDRDGEIAKRIYGFKKLNKFEKIIKKLGPSIAGPESPARVDGSDNATMHGNSASPETVENPDNELSPAPVAHQP
jgi:thiol-disulfide isomerase/thioredoxin